VKSKYKLWLEFYGKSGVSYIEATGHFHASEHAWDDFLSVYPNGGWLRTKPLLFRDLHSEVFAVDWATGEYCITITHWVTELLVRLGLVERRRRMMEEREAIARSKTRERINKKARERRKVAKAKKPSSTSNQTDNTRQGESAAAGPASTGTALTSTAVTSTALTSTSRTDTAITGTRILRGRQGRTANTRRQQRSTSQDSVFSDTD
jgi:hypothetical protein